LRYSTFLIKENLFWKFNQNINLIKYIVIKYIVNIQQKLKFLITINKIIIKIKCKGEVFRRSKVFIKKLLTKKVFKKITKENVIFTPYIFNKAFILIYKNLPVIWSVY